MSEAREANRRVSNAAYEVFLLQAQGPCPDGVILTYLSSTYVDTGRTRPDGAKLYASLRLSLKADHSYVAHYYQHAVYPGEMQGRLTAQTDGRGSWWEERGGLRVDGIGLAYPTVNEYRSPALSLTFEAPELAPELLGKNALLTTYVFSAVDSPEEAAAYCAGR